MTTRTIRSPFGARSRASSISLALTFVILSVVALVVGTVPNMGYVALAAALLASIVAFMRLRPRDNPPDVFEIIVPFSVLYFIYFGVGTTYLILRPEALDYPALRPFLLPALALALLGFLIFLTAYGVFFRRTKPSPFGRYRPRGVGLCVVLAIIGAAGMSVQKLQLISILGDTGISPALSLLQQFGSLFYFSWFLVWYEFWSGRLRATVAITVLGLLTFIALAVLYFNLGGKSLVFFLLALPAMGYYQVNRRLPLKTLVAVSLLTVFVIFPVYNTFRFQDRDLDTTRRLDRTLQVARMWDTDQYLESSVFAFLKRMTIVTSVAAVISDTGRWVDYRYGDTLILAPIGLFIPRFLWPEKPNISIGREFGATFRLTQALDRETEIAPSVVGDFYWNFALPGVVIGMLLLGMGYRWFYQKYGAGDAYDPIRKSIYATLFPTALLFESNVAIIVAGFVKSLLILLLLLALLRKFGWLREVSSV